MKLRKSKFDPFAGQLLEMDRKKVTLDEMIAWLDERGCVVTDSSTLSQWLTRERQRRLQAELLGQIATGAEQCAAVEEAFKKNPAPHVETIIKLHRLLIFNLSTKGQTHPDLVRLADKLTQTVIQFSSAQVGAGFKRRELALKERTAEEFKKNEQGKALEFCLEEARPFPGVQQLFKAAFAALKQARSAEHGSASPVPQATLPTPAA
jgi:hypothetical protein